MSSRIRRGPASPQQSASRGSVSRQSSKAESDNIPASPSRSRRSNNRGRDSSVKVEAPEKDSGDEEEEVETSPAPRSSRSRRPTRNGSTLSKNADPEAMDVDEDEEMVDVEVSGNADASENLDSDLEEIEGEIEEAGEAKITKDGELLGGREYKCRNFKMPTRGNRVYMMSMDPARVLGFRDSYLFFLRNPQIVRVNTTMEERVWMIENGMLMANFKNKLIAVVTARSMFKIFGHRIVKRGKPRIDDYYESRAAEETPAAESEDDGAGTSEDASASMDAAQSEDTPVPTSTGKRKHTLAQAEEPVRLVTDLNWLHESAMAVRGLNSQLRDLRKENPRFLDPHTNIEQVPVLTQPSRCEITVAPAPIPVDPKNLSLYPVVQTVVSIPRSIGPHVDSKVKVEIRGTTPAPPTIQDPSIWAVIPDDIKQALEAAALSKAKMAEVDDDQSKFPLSLQDGQYQATFPVHQARFQQPYRVVLPQSMTGHAQYLHYLNSLQPREPGPIMEQTTLPGHVSAEDARLLQLQMQQQQEQQLQQQLQQQQAKIQQQQALLDQQAAASKKAETPQPQSHGIVCNAPLKTGLGYCQRLVSTQGEHCPLHRVPYTIAGAPNGKMGGPPTCGTCHLQSAPESTMDIQKPIPCAPTHLNKCKTCAKDFHPLCLQLDTPRLVAGIASYPWQCSDCKLCVVCLDSGDEATLLICDACDRGWHMDCCDPAMKEVPQGEWLCTFCAMCHSCRGNEIPTTKYKHADAPATAKGKYPTFVCTYCIVCSDNFAKARFCPVCLKTYKSDSGDDGSQSDAVGDDDNNMVCCDECNRWVHMDCDGQLTEEKVEEMGEDESVKYTCPLCAGKVAPIKAGPANVSSAAPEVVQQSLTAQAPPQGKACGILGGKMRVRGLVEFQGKKLGVPEIIGAGVEYDRKLVSELAALKIKSAKRKRGRLTKSPVRRSSIASSTSSSLSSLTGSVDS